MTKLLNDLDLQHATTKKVAEILEDRIKKYREANDAHLPPDKTAHLRGKLFEAKQLYNLLTTGSFQSPSGLNVGEAETPHPR